MTRRLEVEIDDSGKVHPLHLTQQVPAGRAVLWFESDEAIYPALMSERALADWSSPEEDEAWAYLQPDK